jgi:hypothetical protein
MTDAERAKNLADSMSLAHDKTGERLSYDHVEQAFLYGLKIGRADLSGAEIEALRWLRKHIGVRALMPMFPLQSDENQRAVAAIDKMLAVYGERT